MSVDQNRNQATKPKIIASKEKSSNQCPKDESSPKKSQNLKKKL